MDKIVSITETINLLLVILYEELQKEAARKGQDEGQLLKNALSQISLNDARASEQIARYLQKLHSGPAA